MAKTKILIVGAFPPPQLNIYGGIVTSCKALLDSPFAREFDLILVDSTQISNPPPALARRLFLSLLRFMKFLHLLYYSKPSAAIIFTSCGASLLEKGMMARVCRLMGVPALVFPRAGRIMDDFQNSIISRSSSRFAFGGASRILCQGLRWQEFAITEFGFVRDNAPIVPNWTATTELLAVGAQRAYAPNTASVKCLFLGWLEHKKGIMELLVALESLKSSHHFTLSIAGLGHAEDDVREFIEKHDLNNCVNLLGWVESGDVPALMAVNDVLVLPSWAEGLPNVMIEAMAAGLAVVVSAVGTVPTVVENGKEALLVQPRDVEGLRAALKRLLEDPKLLGSIARSGHELAKREFSVDQASDKLTEIIHEVVAERVSGSGNIDG